MRTILKNLWAHRKQNGWIFAEITLITVLSWFMVDHLVVTLYGTYFCTPAGEFEKEHLCVGEIEIVRAENESGGMVVTDEEKEALHVLKHKLEGLPEVQSVCLAMNYLGENLRMYFWRDFAAADDTTRSIRASHLDYSPQEQYFETQGLRAIEGSPDAESLSANPDWSQVVVTRSMARQLFGTDQVVGKRLSMVDYEPNGMGQDVKVLGSYVIAGVVEDVKASPSERYPYIAFFPTHSRPYHGCRLLMRLKPDVDAEAFVGRLLPTLTTEFRAGIYVLNQLETYQQHIDKEMVNDHPNMLNQLAAVPLTLFCINVILGTLGTFWLQIRKRREDIGIMRAFGASRRRIFGMLLAEGAVLTALASLAGDFIWLQFAISEDVLSDGNIYGSMGNENDWVMLFWPHFLIISFAVFLMLLVVVSLGIIIPAWSICRKKIVETLNSQ